MRREISFEDQEWFLHTHGQKFANAQFAELGDTRVSLDQQQDYFPDNGEPSAWTVPLLMLSPLLVIALVSLAALLVARLA